jgi:hypothetical protein
MTFRFPSGRSPIGSHEPFGRWTLRDGVATPSGHVATLSRKTAKDYVGLTVKGVSSKREADSIDNTRPLAPYWTVGLEARSRLGQPLDGLGQGRQL